MTSKNLVTQDLSKRFGATWALHGLSFEVRPGLLTLLAGRNGAGKTTWMRVATGLAHPTSGTIRFAGAPVHQIRSHLAAVFDDAPVYPHLSGTENLYVLSGGCSLDATESKEILGILRLEPLLAAKAGSYSFGQRKRLAVAAALLRRPTWLLLDEPSVGLDPAAWQLVVQALRNLAAGGGTIVLTGQDLKNLEDLVDEVVVIQEGVAVFAGSLAELQNRQPPRVRVRTSQPEELQALFPGAVVVTRRPVPCLDIPCESRAQGEALVAQVRSLNIPLQSLELKANTLEEALRELGLYAPAGEPEEGVE